MDKKYLLSAFGYLILGLAMGIYMAASKNHSQLVTHAHIMLLGFVVSFIYAVCFKVWLGGTNKVLNIQYYLHQIGTAVLLISLFLMYGNFVSEKVLGPILGLASVAVFVAAVIMKIQIIKIGKSS